MNRRSFFKVLTGYVAGAVAAFVPKAIGRPSEVIKKKKCGGQNGTLCPRCKFNYPTMSAKEHPAMTAKEWVEAQFNPIKELQLGESFTGKIVSMITFQGNLWIATDRDVYRIRDKLA